MTATPTRVHELKSPEWTHKERHASDGKRPALEALVHEKCRRPKESPMYGWFSSSPWNFQFLKLGLWWEGERDQEVGVPSAWLGRGGQTDKRAGRTDRFTFPRKKHHWRHPLLLYFSVYPNTTTKPSISQVNAKRHPLRRDITERFIVRTLHHITQAARARP